MIRQLNTKRQLTIPAPLARRLGFSGKGWVNVSEKDGALMIMPVDIEAQSAKPLSLTDGDWTAFNQKVRKELKAGKGKIHANAVDFLRDLKHRMKAA